MDKQVFKICEAFTLGLKYYYMAPKDKRKLTKQERILAGMIVPTLPKGWMQEQYDWQVFGKKSSKKRKGK